MVSIEKKKREKKQRGIGGTRAQGFRTIGKYSGFCCMKWFGALPFSLRWDAKSNFVCFCPCIFSCFRNNWLAWTFYILQKTLWELTALAKKTTQRPRLTLLSENRAKQLGHGHHHRSATHTKKEAREEISDIRVTSGRASASLPMGIRTYFLDTFGTQYCEKGE